MSVLDRLLGDPADAEPDTDPEPRSDEELRAAVAEAVERTDAATILGVLADDLVDLANTDQRAFSDRLRAMQGLADPVDPDHPREPETIDAEADAVQAAIGSLRDRLDALDAEREAHTTDPQVEAFDPPHTWLRETNPHGEAFIEATLALRDYLETRGEASTDDLYTRYRSEAPPDILSRKTFEARVCPVLADANGVQFRGWRLDPDAPLSDEAIDEYAHEAFPVKNNSSNAVERRLFMRALRSLADAPVCGLTRLELVDEARNPNQTVPERFAGPVDASDLDLEELLRYAKGLAELLEVPGVEPPAEPEWRWVEVETPEAVG